MVKIIILKKFKARLSRQVEKNRHTFWRKLIKMRLRYKLKSKQNFLLHNFHFIFRKVSFKRKEEKRRKRRKRSKKNIEEKNENWRKGGK